MEGHYAASWKPAIPFANLDSEGIARLRKVENALLSLCFGGHTASASTYALLEKYVHGEVSWEEAFATFYEE